MAEILRPNYFVDPATGKRCKKNTPGAVRKKSPTWWIRYYDPAGGTWTVDTAATFPDNQVNNMACADLNGPSGHRIYCVGGSAAGATTSTGAVRVYDPSAHTITALSTDAWPAPANTLPGGWAVVGNKLYILGGFTINVSMSRQIWVFDPNGSAGSRW